MDLLKPSRNANLERRRQALIASACAEAALRQSKSSKPDFSASVRRALDGAAVTRFEKDLAHSAKRLSADERKALANLLAVVAERSSLLETREWKYAPALVAVSRFRRYWIRLPEAWKVGSHNGKRQFASLLRHLLAHYKVPVFFDSVWLQPSNSRAHGWFVHVAQGGNLRKASFLPYPLTKMMVHHAMQAPDDSSAMQALRYGQARGLNVSERHTLALLGTMLGDQELGETREAFWETFLRWLAQHPMVDPVQVGPIVDYLHHQKFAPGEQVLVNGQLVRPDPPQPGLSMKGREPDALVTQVESWHRRLQRLSVSRDREWKTCGIPGFERVEGKGDNARAFIITELLTSAELRTEGTAMRHCVGTYARSCASGRVAIYSMQIATTAGRERMVTIEVDVKNRLIVQARKRMNAASTPVDQRVMNAWTASARLHFGKFALTRWA